MSSKGELDKEKMFQKIMPSARRGPEVAPQTEAPQPQAEAPPPQVEAPPPQAEAPPPQVEAPPPQVEAPQPQVEAPPPQAEAPPPQAEAPQPQVEAPPPQVEVAPPEGEVPYPVNISELLAIKYYTLYCGKIDGCTCAKCKDDTLALTLNKVPVRYVASNHLDTVQPEIRGLTTEVVEGLIKALFIVKKCPRH